MAQRSKLRKIGIVSGVISMIVITLAVVAILFYGGYLTGGTGSSHMEDIDYSDYGWYLMIPLVVTIAAVVVSVYLLTKVSFGKSKKGKTRKAVAAWVTFFTIVGAIIVAFYGAFYVRAYHDSAEVSDIKLQTNAGAGAATIDLGNYTVLSASVEEYHSKDESHYDKYRLLTFDDKWRIAVRLNNSAYWNETYQNLTGVTATLQGYAMPSPGGSEYSAVTGLYAPNTQIGAANAGDIDVIVFEGIARDPRIISFELKILDSDGEELGCAYIHPAVELSEMAWFMNTEIA